MSNNRFLALLWVVALGGAILLLSGCGGAAQERPASAADPLVLPISSPCATQRPDQVVPLNRQMTEAQFQAWTFKQRVAAVGRQALAHQKQGMALAAATGACPEVDGE